MDFRATMLTLLACFQVTFGQTVSVTGPSTVEQGDNTVITCTRSDGSSTPAFVWRDESVDPVPIIFIGDTLNDDNPKYTNFAVSVNGDTSTMTITNTLTEDEGTYRCSVGSALDERNLSVEVPSTVMLTLESFVESGVDMYRATCNAVGSKPQETITWTLNGTSQTDGNGNTIVETNPTATPPLSNTRSVFTFPATEGNLGQTLVCRTSGHALTELNGEESRNLDIHSSPSDAGTTVTLAYVTDGTSITVSCNAASEPEPAMRNYYIYANGSLIFDSTNGIKQETFEDPVAGTNYTCLAGNYLGNTSLSEAVTYDPTRTTTPSPPTGAPDLGPGAIAGIVIGAIVVIVIIIIVIIFCLKKGSRGSSNSGVSAKKHTSSTVGTSNGSEKEKIKPVAAPRDQGSIQHTTDNPGQAEYAMVDRKKSGGGDMPDTRGPSHDSPGMHYADLDLSTNAGHTERQVPQNPDNVVVYSSILV